MLRLFLIWSSAVNSLGKERLKKINMPSERKQRCSVSSSRGRRTVWGMGAYLILLKQKSDASSCMWKMLIRSAGTTWSRFCFEGNLSAEINQTQSSISSTVVLRLHVSLLSSFPSSSYLACLTDVPCQCSPTCCVQLATAGTGTAAAVLGERHRAERLQCILPLFIVLQVTLSCWFQFICFNFHFLSRDNGITACWKGSWLHGQNYELHRTILTIHHT